MSASYDAIVIGAGHNGLVTAAYLARAGLRTLVVERRDVVGGAAVTEEVWPGFGVDTAAHGVGALHPKVVADLGLEREGLRLVRPDPAVFAPQPDGRALLLSRDPGATSEAIRPFSATDAERWPAFVERMAKAAAVLGSIHGLAPADPPEAGAGDLWGLLRATGALRRHARAELLELLRIIPMSVAELADEWFESEALKGALAAGGIKGIFQGPMASGTAYVLLHAMAGGGGVVRPTRWAMGGVGSVTRALAQAARRAGAEIRTEAEVGRILVESGRVAGVVLETSEVTEAGHVPAGGEEIRAPLVISNVDPRRTFLGLLDPLELDPHFLRAVRNIKYRGACAKVNLALAELPDFSCCPGHGPHLGAAISISPSIEYLERAYDDAKYGAVSSEPYVEAFIPTFADPSLAPAGGHVMSAYVQYAPYRLREGSWDDAEGEALADRAISTLTRYAPNLERAIVHRQVLSPRDLEERFALTEGNIHHGELTLDQLLFMRPVPGWARYATPIAGLYLCGAGTHPGGGITGRPGYNAAREILERS